MQTNGINPMSLFYNYKEEIAYSEKEMQTKVVELLQRDGICHDLKPGQLPKRTKWSGRVAPVIIREHHIPQINRRSDIIAYLTPRKIINIECKLTDANGVLAQAIDHKRWADYSFICMPMEANVTNWHLHQMIQANIGLLRLEENSLVEVVQAGYNMGKDKDVYKRIRAVITIKAGGKLAIK